MRIGIVVPAAPGTGQGNQVSASRWARILRHLGHRVRVISGLPSGDPDVLVVLHAKHGAREVLRSKAETPDRPVVLALTGTDLYRDLPDSALARRALAAADRLVVLQPLAKECVPPELRSRVRIVYQSVEPPRHRPVKAPEFRVAVLGRMRDLKDPFRAARAARLLPASSRVRIDQVGGAPTPEVTRLALAEARENPRYFWHGETSRRSALALLGRSRLLVISSKMEGGANVIGEAIVYGVPVLATRIPGNLGLLGPRYPGTFPVGDTGALARLLRRAETDPRFLASLHRACRARRRTFRPSLERHAWETLLSHLPR